MNIFGNIVNMALSSLSTEDRKKIKTGFEKVKEFVPMVDIYHNTILKKAGENGVGYLIRIEDGKINLYQVVTANDEEKKKVYISRTLEKFDVVEQVGKFLAENNVG